MANSTENSSHIRTVFRVSIDEEIQERKNPRNIPHENILDMQSIHDFFWQVFA